MSRNKAVQEYRDSSSSMDDFILNSDDFAALSSSLSRGSDRECFIDSSMPKNSPSASDDNTQREGKKRNCTTGRQWNEKANGTFKKGKFSATESHIILSAMEQYASEREVTIESLCEGKSERGIWLEIASCLPNRSVRGIYRHGIRLAHVQNRGRWTAEEIELLQLEVNTLGSQWKDIGAVIGRTADSCRDKYRELRPAEQNTGKWTKEEENVLMQEVRRYFQIGPDVPLCYIPRKGIPWQMVSDRVGTRSRITCLRKFECMRGTAILEAALLKGSSHTAMDLQLVAEIMDSGASDETEILWTELSHPRAHDRWSKLKKDLNIAGNHSFEDALRMSANHLRHKLSSANKLGK